MLGFIGKLLPDLKFLTRAIRANSENFFLEAVTEPRWQKETKIMTNSFSLFSSVLCVQQKASVFFFVTGNWKDFCRTPTGLTYQRLLDEVDTLVWNRQWIQHIALTWDRNQCIDKPWDEVISDGWWLGSLGDLRLTLSGSTCQGILGLVDSTLQKGSGVFQKAQKLAQSVLINSFTKRA